MLLLQLPRLFSSRHCLILSNRLTKPFIRKKIASTARIEMEAVNTTERLRRLRELMRENKIDIYSMLHAQSFDNYFTHAPQVVPSADSHQSEYIAPCDARRGLTLICPLLLSEAHCRRIHLWLLWIRWHSCSHLGESSFGNRRTIFQPGLKTA